MPTLLRLEPLGVQEAWRAATADVLANERLPEPQPEPYFTRAQLFDRVGLHDDALGDYLTAAALVKSAGNLLAYKRLFLDLHDALRRRTAQPRPPFYGAAWEHYAVGYHAFWKGDLDDALRCFTDAIHLAQNGALFYYYRALTYKRLGLDEEANTDLQKAVHIEARYLDPTRASFPEAKDTWLRRPTNAHDPEVSHQLQRVQGTLRLWLESGRSGATAFEERKRLLQERAQAIPDQGQ